MAVAGGMLVAQGVAAATRSIVDLGGAALDSYAAYERLGMALQSLSARELMHAGAASNMTSAMVLSGERARELQDWMQKLAVQSPFTSTDISSAFRMAMAYGFTSEQAKRLTQDMVDFAAGSGASGEAIDRIAMAMGQMLSRGKVSAEELNQLTEAGIDARGILARAFGVTTATLVDMVTRGLVPADAAVEALAQSIERDFGGAAQAQSGTFSGLLSSLAELKDIGLREFFTGTFQAVQPYLQRFVDYLSDPAIMANIRALGQALGQNVATALAWATQQADAFMATFQQAGGGWNGLVAGVQGLADWGGIAQNIGQTLWNGIVAAGSWVGAWIRDQVSSAWQTFWGSEALAPVRDFAGQVQGVWEQIATFDLAQAWGAFWGSEALAPVRSVVDQISGLWATLTQFDLTKLLGSEGLLGQIFANLLPRPEWLTDLANTASNLLRVPGWVTDLGGTVTSLFTMPGWVTDLGGTVTSLFKMPGWVTDLGGTVTSLFTVPGWLQNFIDAVGRLMGWTPPTQTQLFIPTMGVITPGGEISDYPTVDRATLGWPIDVTPPRPTYGPNNWPIDITPPRYAAGTLGHAGGLAIVGEQGPELLNLPRGAQVLPNGLTVALLQALGVPGYAEGTLDGGGGRPWPVGGAAFYSGNLAAALKDIKDASENIEGAADNMQDAARQFESMLTRVPGLFGTSQVTQEQMDLAALGVPQNFADNYLRRLTDEVLNGVDWAGVDIEDAARRAGIDPTLPAEAILKMFTSAWRDSSLFANPENLDLIDTAAVEEAMARQAAAQAGRTNIMQLFGLTPEEVSGQSAALTQQALNSMIANISPETAGPIGAQLFSTIQGSLVAAPNADSATGFVDAINSSLTLPEVVTALNDVGASMADVVFAGFRAQAGTLPWGGTVPASRTPPPSTTAPVGKSAAGTAWWRGGWTWVGEQGPELLNVPRGASIVNARQAAELGGPVTVNVYATVDSRLDVESLAYRVANVVQRRRR
jgi:tape measure domain-containing protein